MKRIFVFQPSLLVHYNTSFSACKGIRKRKDLASTPIISLDKTPQKRYTVFAKKL